jgi:hypothetical protein
MADYLSSTATYRTMLACVHPRLVGDSARCNGVLMADYFISAATYKTGFMCQQQQQQQPQDLLRSSVRLLSMYSSDRTTTNTR